MLLNNLFTPVQIKLEFNTNAHTSTEENYKQFLGFYNAGCGWDNFYSFFRNLWKQHTGKLSSQFESSVFYAKLCDYWDTLIDEDHAVILCVKPERAQLFFDTIFSFI
jgi:hypothetical protein